MLHLDILGSFSAALDNKQPLKFKTDKSRALLAYLALSIDPPPARSILADLLWSDRGEKAAYGNLRKTLHHLRQSFNGQSDRIFQTTTRVLQLNSAELITDATRFKELIATSESHQHNSLATCPSCYNLLVEANNLYRGELLAGFNVSRAAGFEEWLTVTREQYHQLALGSLHRLTDAALTMRQWVDAQRYASRQVALEPWRESAHAQLIRALAGQGATQAAAKQFDTCKAILWEEMGIEPSADLLALYETIGSEQLTPPLAVRQLPVNDEQQKHNLPRHTTPFFGRSADTESLFHLLQSATTRWVTLIGAGGVGKTRLSQHIGNSLLPHFLDGVWFVPLAGLSREVEKGEEAQETQIATAIASAIGFQLRGSDSAETQLATYLRNKQMLLILDNFEHLMGGAGLVNTLLMKAANLAVLCTSRKALQFRGEFCYQLNGLALPAPLPPHETLDEERAQQWRDFPSMRLFADGAYRMTGQAELSMASLPTVANICRWVGGNALGIELAASWMRHKTADMIWAGLQNSYTVLQSRLRDVPAHQRSMQVVFEQSWQLLTEDERETMAQLSIFRGGFDLAAATTVVGASEFELIDLVEHSMLQHEAERFSMHEALRQFSAEQLSSDVRSLLIIQYVNYFLKFLKIRESAIQQDAPHIPAAEIDRDIDNVLAAWEIALGKKNVSLTREALHTLSNYFQMRGRSIEARDIFSEAGDVLRTLAESDDDTELALPVALIEHARFLNRLSFFEDSKVVSKNAIALADTRGDQWSQGMSRILLAEAHWRQMNLTEASDALASLNKAMLADLHVKAWWCHHMGIVNDLQGAPEQSLSYFEQALELWITLNDNRRRLNTLNSIGFVSSQLNDFARADTAFSEALLTANSVGDHFMLPFVMYNMGLVRMNRDKLSDAEHYLEHAFQLALKAENRNVQADAQFQLLNLRLRQSRPLDAQVHANNALALYQELNITKAIEKVHSLMAISNMEKIKVPEVQTL